MFIDKIFIKDFRLFQELSLELHKKNLLISGFNGSGKTSFLEAINVAIKKKSPRTKDLLDCISHEKKSFILGIQAKSKEGSLVIKAKKERNKRVSIKAILGKSVAPKSSIPIIQFIEAKDLRMIEGETELRRNFFLSAMFHVEHNQERAFKEYKKALNQRNTALKKKVSNKELKIWDDVLIETGTHISHQQHVFFNEVFKGAIESRERTHEKDLLNKLKVALLKGWEEEVEFSEAIRCSYEKDRMLGYTSAGPHRIDLNFSIDKKTAKSVLSRGEQKLLILLMFFKLNKALIKKNVSGILYLLDDITSELDKKNLEVAVNEALKLDAQLFITMIEDKNSESFNRFKDKFTQLNL